LGTPYEEGYEKVAIDHAMKQAVGIKNSLAKEGIEVKPNSEIVALIAYLQRLGTDIKVQETK